MSVLFLPLSDQRRYPYDKPEFDSCMASRDTARKSSNSGSNALPKLSRSGPNTGVKIRFRILDPVTAKKLSAMRVAVGKPLRHRHHLCPMPTQRESQGVPRAQHVLPNLGCVRHWRNDL